jgi:putative SOS response-associated peptidase YedK
MPVILEREQEWTDWLTGSEDDVRHLCDPIERPKLAYQRVS